MKCIGFVTVFLSLLHMSSPYANSSTKPSKKVQPVEVVIKGSIVGADGKPLPIAHVLLWREGLPDEHYRAFTNRQGAFRMKVKVRGLYQINFYGLFHQSVGFPFLLISKQTVSFRVRLATLKPMKKLRPAYVIGAFNQWKSTGAKKMKLRKDGSFALTLPPQKKPFVYQVIGGIHIFGSHAGTQASHYIANKGSYLAVLPPSKKPITLVYNPRSFPQSNKKYKIDVTPESIEVWRDLALRIDKKEREVWKAYWKHRKAGKPLDSFEANWDRELAYLYLQQAHNRDPFVRQYIQLLSYTLPHLNVSYRTRRKWAHTLLKDIPPTSPFWSLQVFNLTGLLDEAGSQRKETKKFKQTMLEQHPNPRIRMTLLSEAIFHLMDQHALYTQAIQQFPKDTARRYFAYQEKKQKLRKEAQQKAILKRRATLQKKRLLQVKKLKQRKKQAYPKKKPASQPVVVAKPGKKKRSTSRKATKRHVAKKAMGTHEKRKTQKRKKWKIRFARTVEKVKKDPKYFLRKALKYLEQMKQVAKEYPYRLIKMELQQSRLMIYPKSPTRKR
ncbi:MAG: hypothetical protein EP343_09215 [Deltaproteobacteria bacterium]|nr:MAG: hypothetical protein EP343_09215 [Deltaproteobacteria bacterium]